ncbi:MAG TPA: hypothetical protein VGR76_05795, partial [Candidatus Angelobacter sp.]|nr:hypothetical protein [Candidatus Angelobacter sp.]
MTEPKYAADLYVNELLRLSNLGRVEIRVRLDDATGIIRIIFREYENRETSVHYVSNNVGLLYDAEWRTICG